MCPSRPPALGGRCLRPTRRIWAPLLFRLWLLGAEATLALLPCDLERFRNPTSARTLRDSSSALKRSAHMGFTPRAVVSLYVAHHAEYHVLVRPLHIAHTHRLHPTL